VSGRASLRRAIGLNRELVARQRPREPPSPLNVDDALTHLQGDLGRVVGGEVRVELSLQASGVEARISPSVLAEVVSNLLANARDAMPRGGVVHVATRTVELDHPLPARWRGAPPGSYVSLTVRDEGEGIAEGDEERIFDPFFTTKGGKGSGVGLASVDHAVAEAGGLLGVDSDPGEGTTFEILLPVVSAQGVATASPRARRD
jgi:signal transduction histidine kinase